MMPVHAPATRSCPNSLCRPRPHLFIIHLAVLVLVDFRQDLINVLVQVSWQSLHSHSRMPKSSGWDHCR